MKVSEIQEKTAIATKWSTITEFLAKIISPFINMILARLLAPEEFGVVATVTMVVSFADMFTDAGFQKYLMQHDFDDINELDRHTNVAFWTNLFISLLLWGAISFFAEPIAKLVGNPGLGRVIVIASLSLPLTSFSSIQMARYKRDFNFKTLMYIRITTSFIPLFITVPLAFLFHSYWALIIGTLCGNLVNAVVLSFFSPWKPRFYYSISILREMFSYSWWILLESVALWMATYIDTFIVGQYLSQYYVGLYKTSITTVNQIMGLITAATSTPLFVALARLKNDKKNLEETYSKYISAVGMFVIPLGVGIWIFRDLVVYILLGEQWCEATDFVGLWGLIYSFSIVLAMYCNGLYNAIGKTYLSFVSQMLQLMVLVPILFWTAQLGFMHLYIARSVVRIELILVQLIIMKFVLRLSVSKQLKELLPSIVCAFFMGLVGYVVLHYTNNYMQEFAVAILCVIVYFIGYYIGFREKLWASICVLGLKGGQKNGTK